MKPITKRENDSVSIKDLMEIFIKENKLHKDFQKIDIKKAWEKLMGSGIVNYTTSIRFQNGTLIVALSSSVLREELSYGKEKIIKMINEEIKENLVKRLMLV